VSGITVGSKSTVPKHLSKLLKIKAAMEEHYSIPVQPHFTLPQFHSSRTAEMQMFFNVGLGHTYE
jgi:hypothetical protein